MSFTRKRFESQLPAFFPSVLKALSHLGFTATLVGGAIRDFVREEKLGRDWDIEVGHENLPWGLDVWKQLGKSLGQIGRVVYLPYDIIRLEVQGYQLEFSPPRKENFEEHLAQNGHKNFSVEFDFRMPFAEAVKRRDFTINAMGMRFKGKDLEFMDPLEGLRHLRENVLHPAGGDFAKDPVRFLRALRFARKYKMELSPELKVQLQTMRADNFTPAYLWSEMQKSGDPLGFYQLLLKWGQFHPEMKLPLGKELMGKSEEMRRVLEGPELHESWMVALAWVGLPSEPWQQYFSLSGESCRRLIRWALASKEFQKILPENFQGEFEVVRETQEFGVLFDWYFTTKQLLQKNPKVPLMRMIEDFLPDWVHLYRFEAVKDVKHIDPPFRAKYQVWNLCQRL